jgi:DNA-binding NarL/FixJ family response regulator
MTRDIQVAIVDDDGQMREVIAQCLAGDPQLQLGSSCISGEQALERLPEEKPDVVLMDINMPGMSGIECARMLKAALPSTRIVMLTVFDDPQSTFDALAAGAEGYLLKRMAPDKLTDAIHEVLGGGSPMSPPIARMVVRSFQDSKTAVAEDLRLSPRELEVLDGLAQGLPYKLIADQLDISMGTIRTHIEHIYRKLHVHNRTDAVVKYLHGSSGADGRGDVNP